MTSLARGLNNFISDVRAATSKEAETARVEREKANIREKFSRESTLNGYQKKKYVWKLVYMFMLGHDIDFGHMVVINLISSTKFSEKNVGYVATSVLLKATDNMMTLVVNSIRNDLMSPINSSQTLALSAIANIGGRELAATLTGDVQRLLCASDTAPVARKKAALTLLRLFRENPDIMVPEEWAERMIALLDNRHLGVINSIMSLILGLVSYDPTGFEGVRPHAILLLSRLAMMKSACTPDYIYYSTPCPWLQVKILRLLQYFPPPADPTQRARLLDTLRKIETRTGVTSSVNRNNTGHAILFEAVNLIISQGDQSDPTLRAHVVKLLGKFISVREPNIRYLGLETMCRLMHMEETADAVRKHQSTVVYSLKDADISVRKRALALLFAMCDHSNSVDIVQELLNYLVTADAAMKEEVVLKIAVLAERYAHDYRWYVDTILQLITLAGNFVSDDIWHRVIQIITNNEHLQRYAAETLFQALESQHVHETGVCVGAYCLGEFGFLIADQPGTGGVEQFEILHAHFPAVSNATQSLMLSAYIKMVNLYEDDDAVRSRIAPVLERHRAVVDSELQQRACEYHVLQSGALDAGVIRGVMEAMPPFPDDRESALEARLRTNSDNTTDRAVWAEDGSRRTGSMDAAEGDGGGYAGPGIDTDADLPPSPSDASPSGAGVTDLLDLDPADTQPPAAPDAGGAGGAGGAAGEEVGIDPSLTPNMRSWFNGLVTSTQGVLFQNNVLQIGVRHEYRAHQGRMSLFFSATQPLENFSVQIPTPPYLALQLGEAPSSVAPGVQGKMDIQLMCMQPFAEAPEFTVSFSTGGAQHVYPLRLPVVATCFLDPVQMTAEDYVARWRALEGQDREQQEIFNVPNVDLATARALLTEKMRIAQPPGVDRADVAVPTVSGVCTMRTGTQGPDGKPISVGALIRLEANAQARAYRVTVRAQHGKVSLALKNVIKAQLLQG